MLGTLFRQTKLLNSSVKAGTVFAGLSQSYHKDDFPARAIESGCSECKQDLSHWSLVCFHHVHHFDRQWFSNPALILRLSFPLLLRLVFHRPKSENADVRLVERTLWNSLRTFLAWFSMLSTRGLEANASKFPSAPLVNEQIICRSTLCLMKGAIFVWASLSAARTASRNLDAEVLSWLFWTSRSSFLRPRMMKCRFSGSSQNSWNDASWEHIVFEEVVFCPWSLSRPFTTKGKKRQVHINAEFTSLSLTRNMSPVESRSMISTNWRQARHQQVWRPVFLPAEAHDSSVFGQFSRISDTKVRRYWIYIGELY